MVDSHEIKIRVRYSDTDAMGVVHHTNYFNYFEMGRIELLRAQGGDYRKIEEKGLFMVVARLNCHYFGSAYFDDILTLRTTVTSRTHAKLIHTYELFRNNNVIVKGESTLACVDRDGKIQRIPNHLKAGHKSGNA